MKITLYSVPGCGRCIMLKTLLNSKNIDFTLVENADKEIQELGFMSAPILKIDDKVYDNIQEAVAKIKEMQ